MIKVSDITHYYGPDSPTERATKEEQAFLADLIEDLLEDKGFLCRTHIF